MSGCGASDSPTPPGSPNAAEETALGHVHGLGVDPADGTLYVASHFGVFRVADGGTPERVADRWQDTPNWVVRRHALAASTSGRSGTVLSNPPCPPSAGMRNIVDPLAVRGSGGVRVGQPAPYAIAV